MKLKTTQQKETELDIPVPSFYQDKSCSKSINDMIAVLNENTICRVWESEQRTCVQNMDTELGKSELITAFLNWTPISETEFLTAYDRAITSMSLTPQLVMNPSGALAE